MSEGNRAGEGGVQAVVLAGGAGTRLKPYTKLIPKPLVPIGGIPVLEVVLRQLARFGFKRVVVTLGHEAQLIRANFSDGSDLGLHISYSEEQAPLGTAGPLGSIENLADQFLVLNGDVLTTLDLQSFFESHLRNEPILTVAAHDRNVPVEFGIIQGEGGRVEGYVEKPTLRYLVSMGIYSFDRRVLRYIKSGIKLDFPDLVQVLLDAGEKVRYYPFDGYWLDIGCREDYERAMEDFPRMKDSLLGL